MAKNNKKMPSIKLKKQSESVVVAFGTSGLPLSQRDDLLDLAIIAQQSQDPTLLSHFEELPPLDQLLKEKVQPLLPVVEALTVKKEEDQVINPSAQE
ncbi:hypothetical protein [Chitinophaga sp. LS1]|uniref:hypothetical protein n=1 Tax=Chitinophaga sp. LS1 TaxID=3051176 RepID=UPI002AAB403D|nr:hypothetical protein [Chitinophaga sp. LS1]WPV66278.1 hypothetical protein QQL36_31260 [Chitinophaga sp. LS1]